MTTEYQDTQRTMAPIHSANNTIQLMTNPTAIINDIVMSLRGYMDMGDKDFVRIGDKDKEVMPIMNEKGIRQMKAIAHSHINTSTIMGFFPEHRVALIMENLSYELSLDFLLHRNEWEMKSSDMRRALIIMMSPIYATYTRSLDGGERKFWSQSFSQIEGQRSISGEQQRTGFKLPFFGKR